MSPYSVIYLPLNNIATYNTSADEVTRLLSQSEVEKKIIDIIKRLSLFFYVCKASVTEKSTDIIIDS